MQYLICTTLLIGLAVFTIQSSLLPWMTERSIRSFENYRYLAARSRIEGDFTDARRCLDAALKEAQSLHDEKKIALVGIDRGKLEIQEKLSASQNKNAVISEIPLIWPSPLDNIKSKKKSKNFERWEPFLRIILQQQTVSAGYDPVRLIPLGDALFEMSQYKQALNCYLKVLDPSEGTKDRQTQIFALERASRVYSSLGNYGESQRCLNSALKLNPADKIPLQLHLAQSYLDGGNFEQTKTICDQLLQSGLKSLTPKCVWYGQLLKGNAESRLNNHGVSIAILTKAAQSAEKLFGQSSAENFRSQDELFQSLFYAGRFEDAKAAYRRAIELREASNPNRTQHTVTLTSMREAQQYMDVNQLKVAIWLWEWSLEDRIKEMGPTHKGVARRLYALVRAYRKAGDKPKMLDAWRRARAITPIDPELD
ncbi:MAG: tetratricopeptide repeat protein [Candidatus Melainabacteria bacterium]|nr:tetratricopeptide repeat protein [Candidatus Melainabacteria bacterium]